MPHAFSPLSVGRRIAPVTAALALSALVLAGPGAAATITVDRTDDAASASACTAAANDCSLRGAITYANTHAGTVINVPAGTFVLTTSGQNDDANLTGDLDLLASMTISGAGAGVTVIDGNGTDAVLDTYGSASPITVAISGVTIRNGNPTGSFFEGGGGIYLKSTVTMTLTNVTLSSNLANSHGGAIWNEGTLTLTGCTLSGNTAHGFGGAVYNQGAPASLAISSSTLSSNAAEYGGALYVSTNQGVTVSITSSTLSGNSANDQPGGTPGDFGYGGALYADTDGAVTITTTSLVNNTAAKTGGAIQMKDSTTQAAVGTLSISFSRVSGNTAPASGSALQVTSGTVTANDVYWGCNFGPGSGGAGCSGTPNAITGAATAARWLQLRHSASPPSIPLAGTATLTADLFGRNSGGAVPSCPGGSCALNSLPWAPSTIFGNPQHGTLSGASAAFTNAAATATFTATSAGPASADATADSQTVTASLTATPVELMRLEVE